MRPQILSQAQHHAHCFCQSFDTASIICAKITLLHALSHASLPHFLCIHAEYTRDLQTTHDMHEEFQMMWDTWAGGAVSAHDSAAESPGTLKRKP